MQVEWLHQLKEEDTAKHKPLAQRENGGRGAGYARLEERSTRDAFEPRQSTKTIP